MNGRARDVVCAFLAELAALRLTDTQPSFHMVERRLLLAGMVSTEVSGDDLECLALRALADAVVNVCWTPTDPDAVEQYLTARRAHLDVLWASAT